MGRERGRTAYTSCFLLLQTPGMKCMSEYFKAMGTSLLVGCTVRESGKKKHSFSPKITQAFRGRDRGHTNIFTGFSKIQGIYSARKGGNGIPGQGIVPAEAKVRHVHAVHRRMMERIARPMLQRAKNAILAKEFLSSDQFKHWILSRKLLT